MRGKGGCLQSVASILMLFISLDGFKKKKSGFSTGLVQL